MPIRFTVLLLLAMASSSSVARDAELFAGLDVDITRLSIEELLNIKVTSVAKKPQQINQAAGAIYVLTSDDIRSSGVTSIPEALRLVPGVNVARIDANKWAVSIRGFNSRTANKLLVLIDGRSIYDPLFSGVLWETKDVMLEDVERVEVIQGPGGTLWGANAVNGVINIITKNAADTQGGLAALGGGTEESAFASLRYGFKLAQEHDLRLYAKALQRDEGFLPQGADDDSRFAQAGFRYDGSLSGNDVSVQGNFYDGEQGNANESLQADTTTSGTNLLGHWERSIHDGEGSVRLQFYYDHTEFDASVLGEHRDTYDVEFQHQLPDIGAHSLIWGLNYRDTRDDIRNTPFLALIPDNRTDKLASVFLQDEIELVADRFFLTLGSKFESNDYTDTEIQPNIRLAWHVNDTDIFWASVSRAVRIPSRLESDFVTPFAAGNQSLDSEKLTAYESGFRFNLSPNLYLAIATFLNQYDDLFTLESTTAGNKAEGSTYGGEIMATYVPAPNLKIVAGYSRLQMDLELDTDSLADPASIRGIEDGSPRQQAFLRIGRSLGKRYALDAAIRYVGRLPAQNVSSYTVADLRIAAYVNEATELSIVGQNLFKNHHFEQGSGQVTQVEDGIYAKIVHKF